MATTDIVTPTGLATTSLFLTPQAVDDSWAFTEGDASIVYINVMSNDLGGNAKTLYSITDGAETELTASDITDLLSKDLAGVYEGTSLGATVAIVNGKIAYNTTAIAGNINALGANETLTDVITYAIRLGNGTLSLATLTVTITGTNDGPTITALATDAIGGVTEDATNPNLTDSGTITFNDVDLTDTHTASVVKNTGSLGGTLSLGAVSESPLTEPGTVTWTYEVTNSATQYLADGEQAFETFTVTIDDGNGGTIDQLVTITITGSNDKPDITGTAVSADKTETDTTLTATGTLNVVDADLSDTVTMTVDSVAVDPLSTFTGTNPLDNAALKAMMAVTGGALAADPALGTDFDWTFTSGSSGDGAFNFLADGETLVLTYTLKATDDSGVVLNNSDTQVVTVTITGSNDKPDITGTAVSADKTETDTTLTATGTLNVVDADLSDTVTMTVDSVAVDPLSTFTGTNPLDNAALKAMMAVTGGALAADPALGTDFDWTFTSGSSGDGAFNFLADGETLVLTYTLKATDDSGVGLNNSDTQVVTVTITGSNDKPDITGTAVSADKTETDTTLTATGTLNVVDADLSDTVTMTVDSVAVGGTFGGTNPLDNAALKAMMAVTGGALAADPALGTDFDWTFTSGSSGDAAFNFLANGETLVLTYTLKATDDSGVGLNNSDTQVVTITITGSNDKPDITGTAVSADKTETDTTLTATGTLNVVDADLSDTVTMTVDSVAVDPLSTFTGTNPLDNAALKAMMAVTGGALAADPALGTDFDWTFTSGSSGDGAFNFLANGETLVLTYTLKATDDSGVGLNNSDTQVVTITITGSNDKPDITGTAVSADKTETDTTLTATGTLNVVDADLSDTVTMTVDSVAVDPLSTFTGTNPLDNAALKAMMAVTGGALAADPALGTDFDWTFTSGSSGDGAFNFLADGETLVLTYTLKATDDSGVGLNNSDTQVVTITITGSNDKPDITGTAVSADKTETDTTLTATGTLNVVDADLSDTVTMTVDSVAVGGTFGGTNPLDNAALKAMMAVTGGALAADPALGTDFDWTFTSGSSGDAAFNFLANGETLVLTYTLKATDDSGVGLNNSDTQVVTVTITGSNDKPDITGTAVSADKTETDTTLTATGTLNVVDADLSDTVTMTVDSVAVDPLSTFTGTNPLDNAALKAMMAVTGGALAADPALGTDFDWTFTSGSSGDGAFNFLANGETLVLTYTLKATDDSGVGLNNSDTQVVTITITGSNDKPDIQVVTTDTASASLTETNSGLTASGTLTVTDVDTSDTVNSAVTAVVLSGTTGGLLAANVLSMLSVAPASGLAADTGNSNNLTWNFNSGSQAFDFLAAGQTLTLTYTVTSSDGNGGFDTQDVAITITGTADGSAPVANNDVWVLSDTLIAAGIITPLWFTHNDTDADGNPLFVTAVSGLPAGLTANFDLSGHLIDITGTPVFDTVVPIVNTYTLTYTLSDGTLTDTNNTVALTVVDTTDNGAENILLSSFDNDFSYIDGQGQGDTITGDLILNGHAGIDTFIGNNGNDVLSGGAGADKLFGNENTDTLNGGDGNDTMDGGGGTDTLTGGAGADTMTGGNNNDIFRWNSTSEFGDTITDFSPGNDVFVFDVPTIAVGDNDLFVENYFEGLLASANVAGREVVVITDDGITDPLATLNNDLNFTNINGGTIFVIEDSDLGPSGTAQVYYHPDPNDPNASAVLVANLTNITDVTTTFAFGDFMFV